MVLGRGLGMFLGIVAAAVAGGCATPARQASMGPAASRHIVFDPEATGYVEADTARSEWPATDADGAYAGEVAFREVLYDYQGRFAFSGNDYVRQFQSVRLGRGRR